MFHHGFDLLGGFLFPIIISTVWTAFGVYALCLEGDRR